MTQQGFDLRAELAAGRRSASSSSVGARRCRRSAAVGEDRFEVGQLRGGHAAGAGGGVHRSCGQRAMQPRARERPMPLHGRRRDVEQRPPSPGSRVRRNSEAPQSSLSPARTAPAPRALHRAARNPRAGRPASFSASSIGARARSGAAALLRPPLPRVIHEDAAHRHRRRTVEMPTALEPHARARRSGGCTPRGRARSAAACDRTARAAAVRRRLAAAPDRAMRAACSAPRGSPRFHCSSSA